MAFCMAVKRLQGDGPSQSLHESLHMVGKKLSVISDLEIVLGQNKMSCGRYRG